jgi:hypothetical protein
LFKVTQVPATGDLYYLCSRGEAKANENQQALMTDSVALCIIASGTTPDTT